MGTENTLLHAKSRFHYWEGPGALSIKTFANGKAYYRTNRGFFAVEEGRYLLLNEGDYTISIESESEIESFCLFFRKGMAQEVSCRLNLDDPFTRPETSVEFIEKTYPNDRVLLQQLLQLRLCYRDFEEDPVWLEEQFHQIMRTLFTIHKQTVQEMDTLPGMHFATREELYRRVSLARDYIEACFERPITLLDLSKTACLSVNHLLRSFQLIYGKTPYQSITERRMREATKLLTKTNQPITEIALLSGYETPSSFNKRFKKQFGMTPSEYHKKVKMDK